MQYAIELYFDKETENELYNLSQMVADAGLSTCFLDYKTRPHLTLACFNDVDEQKCTARLKEFAQNHNAIPAYIGSVGMFNDTKTIFASPIMTKGMYRLQEELHEYMNDFDATGWEWYSPDRWAPHCTLALTGGDDESAFYRESELILREFRKLAGEFVAIGLVKVTLPVNEIYTVELNR